MDEDGTEMHKLLTDRPGKKMLLLGNEAIARGAIEAGVAFATCYPGTPSSEIGDNFFKIKGESDLYFEYSINEKVALDMAAGASIAGLRAICSMKHVGLNVASDTLMTLAYLGVTNSLVVVTADDPSMHSGINEQDNRYYGRLGSIPVIEPSSAQDAKDLTKFAFELSEELRVPVILRSTTRVSHSSGVVELGPIKPRNTKGSFEKEPSRWTALPAFSGRMHQALLEKVEKAKVLSENSSHNVVYGKGKWGIITSGVSFNYVMDAVKDLGIEKECVILKLGFSYPLPEGLIRDLLLCCEKILVVEELEPLVEEGVKVIAQEMGIRISIKGKGKELLPRSLEFNPRQVREVIASYFSVEYKNKVPVNVSDIPAVPERPPILCAGCPHRATYLTVRRVVGEKAIYVNDIGCYALGFFPPYRMTDLTIVMGSSIAVGSSMAKATGKKVIAFIGDSTFFHSGIAPLCNAVLNNHNLTVIILDNFTTGMTGLQPSPGADPSKMGMDTKQLSIEAIVKSIGITKVITINPRKLKVMAKAVQEGFEYQGVSVIIAREKCVLYGKKLRDARKANAFAVRQDKCKMDYDCIREIACPAMSIDNKLIRIDSDSCTGCSICAQICPENAIVAEKLSEVGC